MFGATSVQPREVSTKRRAENLAYIYQQILTVIVRVRQNRQAVSDANAFRANIQAGLRAAEKDAVKKAYSPDDIRNGYARGSRFPGRVHSEFQQSQSSAPGTACRCRKRCSAITSPEKRFLKISKSSCPGKIRTMQRTCSKSMRCVS